MQINAVSTNATTFGHKPSREELEQFAAADDKQLRHIARQVASVQVDDKKHRRISNALWYSIPVAAGLSAAITNPNIIGRIPKVKAFAKTAALWAGTFAVIDATYAAARGLNKHSDTAKEFTKEHPIMSSILTLGAAVGAIFAAGKGASLLKAKYGDKAVKFLKDLKVDKFINDNKYITKAAEQIKKVPSAIKEFGKVVLNWSPMILVATSLGHTFGHEKTKAMVEIRNYDTLKNNQEKVRAALAATEDDAAAKQLIKAAMIAKAAEEAAEEAATEEA